jgi:hypothetical protein
MFKFVMRPYKWLRYSGSKLLRHCYVLGKQATEKCSADSWRVNISSQTRHWRSKTPSVETTKKILPICSRTTASVRLDLLSLIILTSPHQPGSLPEVFRGQNCRMRVPVRLLHQAAY